MIPRLLRLLHSDACVVSWYTAELLGFLSLRDTLLRTILHTAAAATTMTTRQQPNIGIHIESFLDSTLADTRRIDAAWHVWLASLDPEQRVQLLRNQVLSTLQPMLNPGASLAAKLAAARVLRSVALAAPAAPDAAHACRPALAAILRQLVTLACDHTQPPVARAAATSAIANLAAAAGSTLSCLVVGHGGLEAARSLMLLHGTLPGQRWGARLLAAAVADGLIHQADACSGPPTSLLTSCCYAALHVLQQPDEQCQELACHALRALAKRSDAARKWLVHHWDVATVPLTTVDSNANDASLDAATPSCPQGTTTMDIACRERQCPTTRVNSPAKPRRSSLDEAIVYGHRKAIDTTLCRAAVMPRRRCSVDAGCMPRSKPCTVSLFPPRAGSQSPPRVLHGGVMPLMLAQSPTVRLHTCRLLGDLLQDVQSASRLLSGEEQSPTLRALCCQLADPAESVQAEAAHVMLRASRLLAGGVVVHEHGALRGLLRLMASPCGDHQQLAAGLLAALAQHPSNHPPMCRVGVVHALVDMLSTGAHDGPAEVTALQALRALAASPDDGVRQHLQEAVHACPGLSMQAFEIMQ